MADSSVQKLHDAFANAPDGDVTLNDAFWTDAGLTPPADFTGMMRSAFRLAAEADGLTIAYDRADVTPVDDDAFNIPNVHLTFLTADPAETNATLHGGIGVDTIPALSIDVVPTGWELVSLFPAMTGWPFDLVPFTQQCFRFTTVDQIVHVLDTDIAFARGQNLYGTLSIVPPEIQALSDLVTNLGLPTSLMMSGPIVLDKADNETILLPDLDLSAPLSGSGLKLFFLSIEKPRVGFLIETVQGSLPDDSGTSSTVYFQNPELFLGADFVFQGTDDASVGAALRAGVPRDLKTYDFGVSAVDSAHPITPAAVIKAMAGTNYFEAVPAALRSYLAKVELRGFGLNGPLKPPGITTLSILIGTTPGVTIPLFADPSKQTFVIDGFTFNYTLINPMRTPRGPTIARFDATMTIFPNVFKTHDGSPGGLFKISIDQDLNIDGSFDGKASFGDVLGEITGGTIGLPKGVEVDFSDIVVTIRPSERSYAFGFEVDAAVEVPFISDDGTPLIQLVGMQFNLGASTPKADAGDKARTVYTGSITGQIVVGDLAANVDINYDGTQEPAVWRLAASLAAPLKVSDLVNQFFRKYDLPDILPGDLVVTAFDLKATIPGKGKAVGDRLLSTRPARHVARKGHRTGWRSVARAVERAALLSMSEETATSYEVSGTITWVFKIGALSVDTKADIGLAYDGSKPKGERYSGSVIGTIKVDLIGPIEIGYRFGPAAQDEQDGTALSSISAADDDSVTLWLSWNGFRASYDPIANMATFTMTGWSVGSLITALVSMIGRNPYFTLPAPWSVLNDISLDGLSIAFHLKKEAGKPRVSATYTLPSSLDLEIVKIDGLAFNQIDGKVRLQIIGSSSVPTINDSSVLKPEGQDVTEMPEVPGRGNSYFDLRLLALGQRVKIYDSGTFASTKDVITALEAVPTSDGSNLPFDPTKQSKGQPYYDRSADWLVAMDFGLLRLGDKSGYAIEVMIVFNDPDLYGLRLALSGDKVKVLAGLVIDVLYKKITDDIGCYQIEFALPTALRNIDIGAFSVTLPIIGVQIYTNGDFLIDFGFPYNRDFSRSFTAQGIIMGVPVLGSAGFYFGNLSNATATNLPKTTRGTFHPVIVFGFGAQLGVGKTIDKGIFKAGVLITVFGIIEGTIACWHPFDSGNRGNTNQLQGDTYFRISGVFGIIGKLYGTVDFAIIKADVSLTIEIYASIAYESFRAIPLSLTARVSVSVTISIDCGFFSIHIGFSFETSLSIELTIGTNERAPWDDEAKVLVHRNLHALGIRGPAARLYFERPHLSARADAGQEPLNLVAVPQFTVLAPEGVAPGRQEGAFVLLFVMDAPDVQSQDDGAQTSFGRLCAALLPWILRSAEVHPIVTKGVPPDGISRATLEAILAALNDPTKPPFDAKQILSFIAASFTISITAGQTSQQGGMTIFPAIPVLSLAVPDPVKSSGLVRIDFADYTIVTPSYQRRLREIFNEVAANISDESGDTSEPMTFTDEGAEPLAASVFVDYFSLLARQLVQSALDAFDDYAYPLDATTSLGTILDWADRLMPGQLTATALVSANLRYPLAQGLRLEIGAPLGDTTQIDVPPVLYMVQTGDTLASIAARYVDPSNSNGTTPENLILANAKRSDLIASGLVITLQSQSHETAVGDSFNSIAKNFGLTIEALALQTPLYALAGLLRSAIVVDIPNLSVTAQGGETIQDVLDSFHVPVAALLTQANIGKVGLFAIDTSLRFAIPTMAVLPQDALWPAILRTGALRHISGISARYMMHGMRLPLADGLTLSANFLYGPPRWPRTQAGYGVYQLTGQQFPLAETNSETAVTLSRPTAGYDWLSLGGGTSLSIPISSLEPKVLGPKQLLSAVLGSVREEGYTPKVPVLAAEPQVRLAAKRFGVASSATWSTSDVAGLVGITTPPGDTPRDVTATAQPRPILWTLSSALMRAIEMRQAALGPSIPRVADQRHYLPVLAPFVGTRDPATTVTTMAPLADFAFATRVDFKIKHLAQDVDLAPQSPDANDIVPPSSGNGGRKARPLAPYAYEIVGPNASDAVLLERILTAMAGEGEEIISQIFLLYADVNNGAGGLTSRAPAEFLSFIVQSNLSTETNPAGLMALSLDAPAVPRGIANRPAEFIKLLWELSTVNSGGTYLFFQLLEGGGLPPSLFDVSGLATLTLVVAFARDADHPTGARMSNAMNALVTTTQIDPAHAIVDFAGLSTPAPSLRVDATTTPSGLAALYGVDLDGLAKTNMDAALRGGACIPVSGLFRQLLPSDFGHGDPLDALAAYYSSGAVTPIGKADIGVFNPGIAVEPLALLRIPPFVYAVSGSAAPGTTLSALARYYAIDPAAIVFAAREVAGLFADGTVAIDPMSYDVQPNVGLGNAGVSLERERGSLPSPLAPDAPKAEIEAYARASMLQLYQLASAGIKANAFFDASIDSAAFGPKDKPSPPSPSTRARRLTVPRDPPGPDANYLYDQALGFRGAAKLNAAPPPRQAGLPPASANPYLGIGSILQFRLAWQDLFGNRNPGPFSPIQPGDVPATISYADRPIPLDQWPSTNRTYRYDGTPGAPVLHIDLGFDATPYSPSTTVDHRGLDMVRPMDTLPIWQRNAITDLSRFTLIYFQLVQDYTPLNIPGLTGPAITITLHNALLATTDQPLAASECTKLRAYVESAILYLAARADAAPATAPAPVDLTTTIDMTALVETDIVELDVALDFIRTADLVTPALRGIGDGTTVRSHVPTDSGKVGTNVGLRTFAETFETAFITADWQMRIGSSAADPSQPANARAATLWAVRMAQPTSATRRGIGFRISGDALYYAPLPVADQLQTLPQVPVARYVSGTSYPDGAPVLTTFTNVDPNTWFAECLTALDDVLTATYATPCFVLDRLLGLEETPQSGGTLGYLGRLLAHKKTLAKAIASTARTVLDQPDTQRAAASAKLEQALLRRLDNANTLTCVTVLPVTGAIYGSPVPAGRTPPRLFGQPAASLATGGTASTRNDNFALSTGKIALNTPDEGGASALAFVVTSRSAERQAYVELDLSYALSHVECDIHGIPGIENYEQSRWISFLTGPFSTKITPASGAHFAIPVALRALPTPATVVAQTGTRLDDGTGTPADLKSWSYGFSYLLNPVAQDSVVATVEFNPPSTGVRSAALTPAQSLYADLAQFIAIHAAVGRDLESFLRPIDGKSQAKSPEVTTAHCAVAAFENVIGAIATSYKAWADSRDVTPLATHAPPRITYTFELVLEVDPADNTSAITHVRPQSFRQDGQDVANFLPFACVEIDNNTYEPQMVTPGDPATGEVSWRYRSRTDKTVYLSYDDALRDAARRIVLAPLDVFALQKASASVQVVRNRHLAPPGANVTTSKAFEFATAQSRFADPMVPFLDYDSIAVDKDATAAQPVDAWLSGFFGDLLTTNVTFKEPVMVGIETGYSYALVHSVADVPATRVPIGLLPPTGTTGETKPPLIAAVSGTAQAWFDTQQPRVDASATFDFGVTIFSASGHSDMPLLRIGALTLAARNVSKP